MFKDAMRTGFYEFLATRDRYRELCCGEAGMHETLTMRFVECQALLLAPVCPHVAETIWQLMGKPGFIVEANWPEAAEVDELLAHEAAFMSDSVREFRLRLKKMMAPPQTGKGKPVRETEREQPTHVTIYVARRYPSWQGELLDLLRDLHEKNGNEFPDNKEVSQKIAAVPTFKKVMKKTMPFVQVVKEQAALRGAKAALSQSSPFDEAAVLAQNLDYICSTLELDNIDIRWSDEADVDEKVREECRPGTPFITYRNEPGVAVRFVNTDPCNGLFDFFAKIVDGEGVAQVLRRVRRINTKIKARSTLSLWRYSDPILGPRKIPSMERPREYNVVIPDNATFCVDLGKNAVFVGENGHKHDLGDCLVYAVE